MIQLSSFLIAPQLKAENLFPCVLFCYCAHSSPNLFTSSKAHSYFVVTAIWDVLLEMDYLGIQSTTADSE